MNDLNYVLLSGNLTREPDTIRISPEATLCSFSIAVNRSYSDKKPSERKPEDWKTKTSYITIESWGNVAESCAKYLSKGRGVRVVGRLSQNRWTSDGMPRQKMVVIAEHVEFQPDRTKASTVVDADEQAKILSANGETVIEEDFPDTQEPQAEEQDC